MGRMLHTRLRAPARCWALLLCIVALLPLRALAGDWERFVERHVRPDGRVVDDTASHSEGQGIGMLLAAHYRDRQRFERMWRWTRDNLAVREDGLLAWRWEPQRGVTDRNNASDGDLLVAWALVRASAQWESREYLAAGTALARAVREKLTRPSGRGPVLLPGAVGFEQEGKRVLNLSYWAFPALLELAKADPSPAWAELLQSGRRLLGEAKFGRWGLPPDWLQDGEKLGLPEERDARFGYDAMRIPLYLMWSGAPPEALAPFRSFWSYFRGAPFLPAWTRLRDDSVDSHDALKGVHAIAAAVEAYPNLDQARLPGLDDAQPYYSDALLMLTKLMLWERAGR
jgi:endo-1,4-beta-D-glucanase Y